MTYSQTGGVIVGLAALCALLADISGDEDSEGRPVFISFSLLDLRSGPVVLCTLPTGCPGAGKFDGCPEVRLL